MGFYRNKPAEDSAGFCYCIRKVQATLTEVEQKGIVEKIGEACLWINGEKSWNGL